MVDGECVAKGNAARPGTYTIFGMDIYEAGCEIVSVDNPKYYDQITGEIHWPIDDGFLEGTKNNQVIKKGTIFKRYGESSGEFLGNAIDSFESRALAPHSELAEIHYYRLKEDFEMTSGKVASWFGSGGGAEQFVKYKEDGSKYTIDELIKENKLEDITESVKDGRIEIE